MPTAKTTVSHPGLRFLVEGLRANPNAAYADLAARAKTKKLVVWPIMFGRAKVLVGLVKPKPRRSARALTVAAAPRATPSVRTIAPDIADLFERLDDVARTFRDGIIGVLGTASLTEIAALVGKAPGEIAPTHVVRDVSSEAPAAAPATRGRKLRRRDSGSLQRIREGIVRTLSSAKQPLGAGEIAAALEEKTGSLVFPLSGLRASGAIRMKGSRGKATYTIGSKPQ